jgi:hypothetical protein
MAGPCWQLIEWYYRWSVLIWVRWRHLSKCHVLVHSHLVLCRCRLVCGREGLSVVRIGFRQVFVCVRSLFVGRLGRERAREERERPNFLVGGYMHLRCCVVAALTRVSRAVCGFHGGKKQTMQRAVWRGCRGQAPPPTSHCPTLDAADGCRAPTCAPPNLPPASAPTPRRLQTIRPPSPF